MVLLASSVVSALHLCPHLYTNQLVTGYEGLEMLLFFVLVEVLTHIRYNFEKKTVKKLVIHFASLTMLDMMTKIVQKV